MYRNAFFADKYDELPKAIM